MSPVMQRTGSSYPDFSKTGMGDTVVNQSGVALAYGDLVVIDGTQAGGDTTTYDDNDSYLFTARTPEAQYVYHGLFRVVVEPNGIPVGGSGRVAGRIRGYVDMNVTSTSATGAAHSPVVARNATRNGVVAIGVEAEADTKTKVLGLLAVDTTLGGATQAKVLFDGDVGFGRVGDDIGIS